MPHVCWQGGATETLEVQLPLRYPESFIARIRELVVGHHDKEIVELLRADGNRSWTGKPLAGLTWCRSEVNFSFLLCLEAITDG
jgi:hypothetical protein